MSLRADRLAAQHSRRYRPSNNPDIALAQEWIEQLDGWYAQHGLKGYDPFDIKQHPRVRSLQHRPLLRKTSSALTDMMPLLSRQALQIQPSENAKAFALMAHGSLRMFRLTGNELYRRRAIELLSWLLNNHADAPGLSWGYPFGVRGSGVDTPEGTPVAVVSAIAGQALLEAHTVLAEPHYLDAARQVGVFLVEHLPRRPQEGGTYCFAYTPSDQRRVHNANLLVVEHLYRLAQATGEEHWQAAAVPALEYTLQRQRADGSWPYGEWSEGEPYERRLMELVDHHHTGFVLRSLRAIHKISEDPRHLSALRSGFEYYRKLISPMGMPSNAHGAYPVDIHACAEAILCPAALSGTLLAAKPYSVLALRWTHFYLRDPETGAPYYRRYPLFTSRITFPRWGVAWMYRALSEYLWRTYPTGARSQ